MSWCQIEQRVHNEMAECSFNALAFLFIDHFDICQIFKKKIQVSMWIK